MSTLSRSVLRLAGEDTLRFLQTLTTQDVVAAFRPSQASAPLPVSLLLDDTARGIVTDGAPRRHVLTAFLTPQGRMICDAVVTRDVDEANVFYVDTDSRSGDVLRKHLLRYKLRSPVDLADVSAERAVVHHLPGVHGALPSAVVDPRTAALGLRDVVSVDAAPAHDDAALAAYHLARWHAGVPEGPEDMPRGDAVVHECNLVTLGAVSFKKGCYLGQELTARTQHRGEVRKHLRPVALAGDVASLADLETLEMEAVQTDGDAPTRRRRRAPGILRSIVAPGKGFALVRDDVDALTVSGVPVDVLRPYA